MLAIRKTRTEVEGTVVSLKRAWELHPENHVTQNTPYTPHDFHFDDYCSCCCWSSSSSPLVLVLVVLSFLFLLQIAVLSNPVYDSNPL